MRRVKAALAAGVLSVGMMVVPLGVSTPTANAYIDCVGGGVGALGGGQRCVDYRPDGTVWWKDSGCAVGICWEGPWYPAPPP